MKCAASTEFGLDRDQALPVLNRGDPPIEAGWPGARSFDCTNVPVPACHASTIGTVPLLRIEHDRSPTPRISP